MRGKKTVKKGHRVLKVFLWLGLLGLLASAAVLLAGMVFIRQRLDSLPEVDAQYLYTYEPSRILDKNGNVIWEPTDRRVENLSYEEIPELYRDALIAVEDGDYWENPGVSVKGVINMVLGTIRSKVDRSYVPRGGSTLEQQLIKNRFYDGGEGYEVTTRKIQELFLAVQLDENFTKEEILEFYVNHLEFAEGSFGLGAIMNTYFGKSPEDYRERTAENISQLAYLAGLSQAPSAYNLYEDPEAAGERRDTVLDVLLEQGLITEVECRDAKAYDLESGLKPRWWEAEAQAEKNLCYKHYTDGVLEELSRMGYDLDKVSLEVKTFLDPDLLSSIESIVWDQKYYLDEDQQAAVAVVRHDGVVCALVGSAHAGDEYNRAVSAGRSSGSSMKPFTAYGPLLQYLGDKYDTSTPLDTSDYLYPGTNVYMHNYGGAVYGMQPLRSCLRHSYNTPVARAVDEILGTTRVKTFLSGLGLDVQDSYSAGDGIGLFVSPLQSAAAYNALNNLGEYTAPRFIDTITFSDGSVKTVEPETRQAMNPSTAYVLNQVLRGVPAGDGTAGSAAIPAFAGYAGKTGTVGFAPESQAPMTYGDGDSDSWYCSYTNGGYSVSVWAGYDEPESSPRVPDHFDGPQRMNRDLQVMLNAGREVPDWKMPEGVKKLSGDGIYAHYRVTDSQDINDTGISWADISGYQSLAAGSVVPSTEVPADWEQKEASPWLSYYRQNGAVIGDVIGKDVYDMLKDDAGTGAVSGEGGVDDEEKE